MRLRKAKWKIHHYIYVYMYCVVCTPRYIVDSIDVCII